MQIGIRVASPTNSTKSIPAFVRPELVSDSSKHFLNLPTNGAMSSSSSSLLRCLCKSSSSMRASQCTSASLLEVNSFLTFSIASSNLNLHLGLGLGSQPYFFSNSPPSNSKSKKSIYLAPKFLSE